MTQVREVMNGPAITVDPNTSAAEAARLMRDQDTGDVLIAEDGRVTGIVTDRHLAVRLVAEGLDPNAPISEVCTAAPISVAADDTLHTAAQLMQEYSIRRLPVRDNDSVVGFISLGDLAQRMDTGETLTDISTSSPNW
jgi:CBS domain-containing protein